MITGMTGKPESIPINITKDASKNLKSVPKEPENG
jgi:hypothetical protein